MGPLIMGAAAAFVLWKLNLEVEGSLPLSQVVPVLCNIQINAATTEVLHHSEKVKVVSAPKESVL